MNNYYIALNDCKYINKLLNSLILNIDEKYIIDNNLDKEKIEDLLKVLLRNLTLFMCSIDRTSSREDLQFLLESGNFWATEFVDKSTVFEMQSKTLTDIRYNEKKAKEEFNKNYGVDKNNHPGVIWSVIFDLVDNSSNVTLSLRTLVVIYSLIEHYLTTLMSLDERISYSEKTFIVEYTQNIRQSLVGRWPEYLSNFDFNKILTEINRLYDKAKEVNAYLKYNVLDSIYAKYINNTKLLIKHIPYDNNEENVQKLDNKTINIIKEDTNYSNSIKTDNIVSGNHYVQAELPKTLLKKQEEEVVVTETLEELLANLNELIGLDNIKKDINDMVNLIKVRNMRKEKNLPVTDMSFHLVFTGNPGTGKTTIARLISKIYNKLGVVSKGQLVEVDRSGLIAGYVGQTAIKVKEKVDEAMGGVLFIDEAYTLTQNDGENDFAEEAVATLLKYMEDYRNDLVVIVAGYTDLMQEFIASNPGLKSRFNKYLEFKDYTIDELKDIFLLQCKKNEFTLDENLHKNLKQNIQKQIEKHPDTFGNARGVRNYFEKVLVNQANRLTSEATESITVDKLKEITKQDLII